MIKLLKLVNIKLFYLLLYSIALRTLLLSSCVCYIIATVFGHYFNL